MVIDWAKWIENQGGGKARTELARKTGVCQRLLYYLVNRERRPTWDVKIKIATAFPELRVPLLAELGWLADRNEN